MQAAINRKRKVQITVICAIVLIASVTVAIFFYPLQAIIWHATHGSQINVGDLRVKLPLRWWPTRCEKSGEVEISRSVSDQLFLGESLDIRPLNPNEIQTPDQFFRTRNAIAARIADQNKVLGRPSNQAFAPIEIQAVNLRLSCLVSGTTYIGCRSPELPWNITLQGFPNVTKEEAESILTSVERTH